MPTDYKKLLEACPLVDKADESGRLHVKTFGTGIDEEGTLKQWRKDRGAMNDAALEAQPELNEALKQGSADERTFRAQGREEDFVRANRRAGDALELSVENLRKFCKAPSV
jgi:hypothetical protein